MPEATAGDFKVGITRLKYLDTCNMQLISNNIDGAKEAIDAFLNTIKDNSEAGIEIKKGIDQIEENRISNHKDLRTEIAKKGFLEQSINWNDGHNQIDVDSLLNIKALCWAVALEHNLFHE